MLTRWLFGRYGEGGHFEVLRAIRTFETIGQGAVPAIQTIRKL